MALDRLPPEVAERIGPFYVYALVDPRNGHIFYVGKGRGQRLMAHGLDAALTEDRADKKTQRIREIRAADGEPQIDVVRHGLSDAEALRIESALIDCLPGLTNAVRGFEAAEGRVEIHELAVRYGATPVPSAAPPALLIRLSRWSDSDEEIEPRYRRRGKGYRPGMTTVELADSTRAWWRVSPETVRRRGIRYAVAVHEGVTRGVLEIGDWIGPRDDGRRAFTAEPVTGSEVWAAWVGALGRKVEFAQGAANPIRYWPRPV